MLCGVSACVARNWGLANDAGADKAARTRSSVCGDDFWTEKGICMFLNWFAGFVSADQQRSSGDQHGLHRLLRVQRRQSGRKLLLSAHYLR